MPVVVREHCRRHLLQAGGQGVALAVYAFLPPSVVLTSHRAAHAALVVQVEVGHIAGAHNAGRPVIIWGFGRAILQIGVVLLSLVVDVVPLTLAGA